MTTFHKFKKPETLAEARKDLERLRELFGDLARLSNRSAMAMECCLTGGEGKKPLGVRIVITAPLAADENALAEYIAHSLASCWDLLQNAGENINKSPLTASEKIEGGPSPAQEGTE